MVLTKAGTVGITVIHRERLQAWTLERLNRECRKLSDEWVRAGSPTEVDMPSDMLKRYVVLKSERARRGDPQRLF